MENYEEKFGFLLMYQNLECPIRCVGCRGLLSKFNRFEIDLDHIFQKSRQGKFGARWAEEYHEFGDSVINLRAVPHNCHIGGKCEGARYTDREAKKFEHILRTEKWNEWTFGDVVNLRSDACFDDVCAVIEETMTKFEEVKENA